MKKNMNKELNQAIAIVLTTKYKKDAREAHQIVEAAGYEIAKWDGWFSVYNPVTKRRIYINESKRGWRATTWVNFNSWLSHKGRFELTSDKMSKFDFTGCLETPENATYWKAEYESWNHRNKAEENAEKLRSARWSVKYHEDYITRIQKQLETLQKDLMYHTSEKVRAEMNLTNVMKEIGLTK